MVNGGEGGHAQCVHRTVVRILFLMSVVGTTGICTNMVMSARVPLRNLAVPCAVLKWLSV
jgi:hypothetical protein